MTLVATDLKAMITLTHNTASLQVATAVINATDKKKIDLTFAKTKFAAGDTLKIAIKADAVKNSSGNNNTAIEITVKVTGEAGADTTGPGLAAHRLL